MTIPAPSPPARDPLGWLNSQPYLLLSLTSLFWAGNIVLGRYVAGHVPPMTLSYWALQHTQALNALLIQSSGPLFVALWSLLLFGLRLTWAQLAGITISLAGVLTIILRGDFATLAGIQFNKGDLAFAAALLMFGLYSALMLRRPKMHQLSPISFTTGCGALLLLPFSIWEFSTGFRLKFEPLTVATPVYVVIFPSTLAYLFFNRGIALIGPDRAAPFFHL